VPFLLLLYKIPPEPTAGRVYVWRKLKAMGALLLHDAAWVLPANERTREQFQWLAVEIQERGGEALVWEAEPALPGQQEALAAEFRQQAEAGYQAVLDALAREPQPDLAALSRRYQQTQAQDYFHAPLGRKARAALLKHSTLDPQARQRLLKARGGGA
jgi:hypothetical protein